jgi:hypothetical protein
MKRSHCLLSAAIVLALGVIGLAVPTRESAPPAPPALAQAPPVAPAPTAPEPVEVTLKRGETLEAALRRGGIERAGAAAIVTGLRGSVNMRRLAPGERLTVKAGAPDAAPEITWTRSPAERYEIRSTDGRWTVEAVRPDVDTRVVAVAGEVRDSLFASMERLGETANLTARLVSLFEWDFDFAADSLPGDRFRFLVEKRYVGDQLLGYGDILVAQYMTAGRPMLTSVAFQEAGSRADYYDASGRSVRKMFLRAPPASPTRATIRSWAASGRTWPSTTERRSALRCARWRTAWSRRPGGTAASASRSRSATPAATRRCTTTSRGST